MSQTRSKAFEWFACHLLLICNATSLGSIFSNLSPSNGYEPYLNRRHDTELEE